MRKYTTVEDFYNRMADAHEAQAGDSKEHPVTRSGAQARADHFREIAEQAREQNPQD